MKVAGNGRWYSIYESRVSRRRLWVTESCSKESENTGRTKMSTAFMETWPIPGLGWGRYKASLQHSELTNKKALKDKVGLVKGHRSWLKGAPTGHICVDLSIKKRIMMALDYKTEGKEKEILSPYCYWTKGNRGSSFILNTKTLVNEYRRNSKMSTLPSSMQ